MPKNKGSKRIHARRASYAKAAPKKKRTRSPRRGPMYGPVLPPGFVREPDAMTAELPPGFAREAESAYTKRQVAAEERRYSRFAEGKAAGLPGLGYVFFQGRWYLPPHLRGTVAPLPAHLKYLTRGGATTAVARRSSAKRATKAKRTHNAAAKRKIRSALKTIRANVAKLRK